ncbi:GntR family transcriptional regulator [Spongiactinospora rosea]|uniref:GntR family transcriptional regulator n=1 Tax=Spongiactinospora rosea TaxID=2248750 RepID=A0A366LRH6_9ACTN|nr:GntR family transcriptional regulator [Spongiactinospora rosea]RBQ16521.1 GntR family transcriptional regulator [Spongiactinospora rosea]
MASHSDTRPRHQQIAADLRAQIMAGILTPGTQLPSTQQLVERYATANATVQRALSILKEEGHLYGRAGKGVYVRDRHVFVVEAEAYFAPSSGGYSYRILDVAEVQAPPDVADALGEERAILRHRLTMHDGDPVELSWSYYPTSIAASSVLAGRGKISGGAPVALAQLGYPQVEFTDRVSTRPPTSDEVEGLALPEGVPVIRQFRVIFSHDKRPVEVSIIIKGGHLYELMYRQIIN